MRFSTVAFIAALSAIAHAAPAEKRADVLSDVPTVLPTDILTAIPTDILTAIPTSISLDSIPGLSTLLEALAPILSLLSSLPIISDLPIVSDLLDALSSLSSSLSLPSGLPVATGLTSVATSLPVAL
ncbi:hypothetical protein PSN45_001186 [Yamadazyma tenuis]|uniref:Uncharacterized protein n=1 Tax=Candida tenuis (strain ATCC 10573 / BCRC 21748 / CBS 615 / JCM 9827 / NBRC 10315 / NRRL Y-1498 / VKM Y-70) TaxID=590646 RepID=G3B8U9_CANTC|nr:uncharacterized protein CANTEDRAFT_136369 [Yamadazyma tenuis ATCC 10573]EGV62431.1 hypothetical protein CANTEDRAFT_136369 [Yamadazyma tenuis ATCC 10573]WEJ93714.1 hypothetical protein PSN45_001186 [Yamadazyma tenuis]